MNALELNKQIKNELKERVVTPTELLQYEIIARENKLKLECVLKAVQFAKLIKGASVNKGYIVTILNDWIKNGINTTAKINAMLIQKSYCKKNNQKYIKARHYSKEEIDSLFDDMSAVVLWKYFHKKNFS